MYGSSPLELMAAQAMLNGQISCMGFTYSATFVGANLLGANATINTPTQIANDSDFVIQRINLVSFTAADTPEGNPDFNLQLTLQGSGRNLFDAPQNVNNICGNFFDNRVPNDLPFPILIQQNNTLTSTLINNTAVAQLRTQISYVGFKVWYLNNADGKPATRSQIFHMM